MAETKRWLRRIAVIGGALGLSSVLSSLARPSRPKDKGFAVSMPTSIEEAGAPVTAIFYEDWGRVPRAIGPQVIVAVYSDGLIIWSGDSLRGGPPYRAGKAAPLQVQKMLDDLDRTGHFTDPVRKEWRLGPDTLFTEIAIAAKTRRLNMASWHEVAEARPGLIATASGINHSAGATEHRSWQLNPKATVTSARFGITCGLR